MTKFPSDEISMDEFSLGRDFRDDISVDKISKDEISAIHFFFLYFLNYSSLLQSFLINSPISFPSMISIELWRARIGLHCSRKCNNNYPQSTTDQSDSFVSIFWALIACIIAILLVIGGIEINPGPITPTQDTPHKQVNLTDI